MSKHRVKITFADGSGRDFDSYETYVIDGILKCRLSHNTSYRQDWENFPLVSMRSWRTE